MTPLSSPPAYLLRALLIQAGAITGNEENPNTATLPKSWVSFMPDEICDGVCFYDTPARSGGMGDLRPGPYRYSEYPGVQVYLRANTYHLGWSVMVDIQTKLDSAYKVTVEGPDNTTTVIDSVSRVSNILSVGNEIFGTKRRNLFSLNVFLHIAPNTQ